MKVFGMPPSRLIPQAPSTSSPLYLSRHTALYIHTSFDALFALFTGYYDAAGTVVQAVFWPRTSARPSPLCATNGGMSLPRRSSLAIDPCAESTKRTNRSSAHGCRILTIPPPHFAHHGAFFAFEGPRDLPRGKPSSFQALSEQPKRVRLPVKHTAACSTVWHLPINEDISDSYADSSRRVAHDIHAGELPPDSRQRIPPRPTWLSRRQ
jgi:hypothetical protein